VWCQLIVGKRQQASKFCFSKILLIMDYAILGLLLVGYFVPSNDKANWTAIVIAWIAQVAISTGAYYWKAKAENLVKLPLLLLAQLPEDMRERADPNQIIASVLGIGTQNNNN
jgi:hypothetical protein